VIQEIRKTWPGLRPNPLQITGDETSADEESAGAAEQEPTAESAGSGDRPPMVVIPAIDGITIMSDDVEALTQLETLVRALARREVRGGTNFGVFPLEHASATRLAQVLNTAYSRSGYSSRGGRVQITADERLNALIVIGGRAERRDIQALLAVLDSDQAADLVMPTKPTMIPLVHASAESLLERLRELYKTQLSEDAGQPPIEIPPGADVEVVAMLQQINAARRGPLLALDVDRELNALMVIAPRPLVDEIRTLAQEVDRESAESRIGIRVVPLEVLQGDAVFRSLERLLDERGRRRR
jgi:type II secretory pathway component GspD/PulD (secretin)